MKVSLRREKWYVSRESGAAAVMTKDEPGEGLREQNKVEKRQRIRAAARELFSRHGYEAATLRQIAKRAHVGLGTLFNYAQDKRDLVFLIFNEELAGVTEKALKAAGSHHSLVDQLIDIYTPHYEFFGKHPALSRILLKELTFYSEGKQAGTFHEIRHRLIVGIEALVRRGQQKGRIRAEEEADMVALHIFFVCSGAIRWWIAGPTPLPKKGLNELRSFLELLLEGLAPAPQGATQRRDVSPSRQSSNGTRPRAARK